MKFFSSTKTSYWLSVNGSIQDACDLTSKWMYIVLSEVNLVLGVNNRYIPETLDIVVLKC